MTDRILTLLALLVLAGFLLILASALQRVDLWVLVLLTVLLAGWDFLRNRP